jgi:hypothetical protein
MHRTGATHPVPGGRAGDEPEQIEDSGDGDTRPDFRVTKARHDGDLREQSRAIRAWKGNAATGGSADREEEHVHVHRCTG